jgi:methyl-accepting chemotaxis protein
MSTSKSILHFRSINQYIPMKFKINTASIAAKVSLLVVVTTFVLVTVLISYSVFVLKDRELEGATKHAISFAKDYCGRLKAIIEVPLDGSRAIGSALLSTKDEKLKSHLTRDDVNSMLKNFVQANPSILGSYTGWEPNAFDGLDSLYKNKPGYDQTGRFVPYWVRSNGALSSEVLLDYEVPGAGDYYQIPKRTKQEAIINPYLYPVGGKEVLMMSMVSPIIKGGEFLGITGADLSLEWIQSMIDEDHEQVFEGKGSLYIFSHDGTIVAVTGRPELSGKPFSEAFANAAAVLKNNGEQSFIEDGILHVFVPMKIGYAKEAWKVGITVPVDYLTAHARREMVKMIVISVLFLAGFTFAVLYILKKLVRPIADIAVVAEEVALGKLDIKDVEATSSEIDKLNKAFLKVIDSQRDITSVCTSIATGDFSKVAIVKSEQDLLAQSVNKMCVNLQQASEEDARRNWAAEGLAKFAGVLRMDKDINLLAESVLSNLIKYLKANQGGLFITDEDKDGNVLLKLRAAYAYERKKFIERTIAAGEGLVGQCYLEKQRLYLTHIPANYISITSGLGNASPNSLLIVPLINNNEVEGVIEIASFNTFEPYEIDFIEKVAESIASTLSSVKVNQRTRELLQQSQQQAEELKAQEEEMRQNLEEISATQEEMRRKEMAYCLRIEELEKAVVGR